MVYASEVSSTCWVKSQSGDFFLGGGMETGEPDPVCWARRAWRRSWGNKESSVGKVEAVKGLPCVPFREWGLH